MVPEASPSPSPGVGARVLERVPGVLLCALIAAAAILIGHFVPWAGTALPAILLGVLIAAAWRPGARWTQGITFSSKMLLQIAVVLLGAQLSLGSIAVVGGRTLPVLIASLAVAWLGASLIGRLLRVPRRERTLIGVGTAICGASAIAAISPVIRAKSAEVSYAVATIFTFNVLAIAIFPAIGHALNMPPETFAVFAGTAVNDTSSVVATASIYAPAVLGVAVTVKLVRTLAIIPISVFLAAQEARRETDGSPLTARRVFSFIPWFLFGFLAIATLNTVIGFPAAVTETLTTGSTLLITVAMAGIGLSTNFGAIRRAGWRPLLLGAILWALVIGATLLALRWFG
ncbi:putative sulfate exporter family transporter [Leucobacter sp. CSA2]|uniref:Sulfate exporter family transporter n=1 Tax=Leucobacter edaphi TaxID=2796472 RepID=A0A934UYF3_9MICO|nr:putative sulfate exporter family transporter [Leucobacter edaphi]